MRLSRRRTAQFPGSIGDPAGPTLRTSTYALASDDRHAKPRPARRGSTCRGFLAEGQRQLCRDDPLRGTVSLADHDVATHRGELIVDGNRLVDQALCEHRVQHRAAAAVGDRQGTTRPSVDEVCLERDPELPVVPPRLLDDWHELHRGRASGQLQELVLPSVSEQPRSQASHRVEALVDRRVDALSCEPVRGREQLVAVPRLQLRVGVVGEPRQDLGAVEPPDGSHPQRARLGLRLDNVQDRLEMLDVRVGVERRRAQVLTVLAPPEVVIGLVGEHGDPPGPEVGLEDDVLVLHEAPALREADPGVAQEVDAEELVRGKAAVEQGRRRLQGHPAPIPREHGLAAWYRRARVLAEHHVRALSIRLAGQALEGGGSDLVVRVDEVDIPAARRVEPDVPRPPRCAGRIEMDHPDVAGRRRRGVQPLRRPIGRAVIDQDDLVLGRRHALPGQGREARLDLTTRIEHGDHDADPGW